MSSYHSSFTYKNKNSLKDMNLVIASFEPDNGFTDTYRKGKKFYIEENHEGLSRYNSSNS